MKKYLGIVLLFVFLVTGCVKGDFRITMNEDGSADLDYKMALNAAMISQNSNPLEGLKKDLLKEGFQVSTYKDGNYFGVRGIKHVDQLEEIKTENTFALLDKQRNKAEITVKHGLFYDTYTLNAGYDLRTLSSKKSNGVAEAVGSMLYDQVDLKFSLTLPMNAESNNASRILSEENFKTYQWDLLPGQNNEITLTTKVLNVNNILYSILVLAVLMIVAYYFMRKRSLKTV
ncbi:DUF3153 domain-containing protein [Brevibacillus invocatus]|uniref:DUF3153 domain-containing protein n=1 Tax=Brevibacillus invocatus TaxID=173959 RepID=A0A3M8CES9_9BACL|nr:DUF3153 domain-containing protein [Brevibacillus invocatus]RNB74041.1 DUF3153 domain-containing protein [Brevibacillus invocatus]